MMRCMKIHNQDDDLNFVDAKNGEVLLDGRRFTSRFRPPTRLRRPCRSLVVDYLTIPLRILDGAEGHLVQVELDDVSPSHSWLSLQG